VKTILNTQTHIYTAPQTHVHTHTSATDAYTKSGVSAGMPTKVRMGVLLKQVDQTRVISVFQWNRARDAQVCMCVCVCVYVCVCVCVNMCDVWD